MRAALFICLALAATGTARADWLCPEGFVGSDCGTPTSDMACMSLTGNINATVYTNFTYSSETMQKSYACTTEGSPLEDSVTDVWAQCFTDIKKCDVHFSLGGNSLTCSGLQCNFDGTSVFCGYTKCMCDSSCPTVNGVSLAYMLDKLTGQTVLDCDDASGVCNIDIQGLSTTQGGFDAFCRAGECREP